MMNIIDFVKEFEFKKRRRLRSWGGTKICPGGCEYMLRGVRPDRGASLKPPLWLEMVLFHLSHKKSLKVYCKISKDF